MKEGDSYKIKKGRIVVGTIPYNNENKIILVSSRKHPGEWVLPKGGVEEGETLEFAATRETFEEAGVEGKIQVDLGIFEGTKITLKGKVKPVKFHMFSMKVNKELQDQHWVESDQRIRKWVSIDEAINMVRYDIMKEALKIFKGIVA